MSLLGGNNNPLKDSKTSRNTDSQKPKKSEKKKTTYSLNAQTMDDIDMLQLRLKRLLGQHVEKSEIIEAAFLTAQKDFERNAESADFIPELMKLLRS